ncbi:Integrase catalytic domain-containing protein [Abeliophyllum distichum]|uniref:Integrase catalytic domain-containing protein n=1 Tax=Abeliophyllum distichum TaxID=126358 RepID=A0ABD1QV01_9LAMI
MPEICHHTKAPGSEPYPGRSNRLLYQGGAKLNPWPRSQRKIRRSLCRKTSSAASESHIVSDNGMQFVKNKFNSNCENLGIRRNFSTPYYPQANGQFEAVNKIIKHTLKRRLESAKGGWTEELLETLWSYRTTSRTVTGETSFAMAYGAEAMIPVEVGIPSQARALR